MIQRSLLSFLIVGITLAPGCGPPNENARVFVEYKQVANFHDYRLSPDSNDSHGAGGMFIMYKITQVKNTGSAAKPFVFDVNKVITDAPDKISNETVTDANILLGGLNVTTVNVGAGQTKLVNGCIIKDALTSNPQALVSAQVPLSHQIDPAQPVTMTNLTPNGSVAVVGNALPASLQALCAGS